MTDLRRFLPIRPKPLMPIRTLKTITFLAAALSKRFHGLWGAFAACGNRDILPHPTRTPQNVALNQHGEFSTKQLRIMLAELRACHVGHDECSVIGKLTKGQSVPVRQDDIDIDAVRAH